jgi:hypothetical protein
MLGHSSATMTMDTYGHLFENRLDDVAEAMDAARLAARSAARNTAESAPRTNGEVARADSRVAEVLLKADVIDLAAVRAKSKTPGQRRNSKGAPGRIRTYATASGEPEDDD